MLSHPIMGFRSSRFDQQEWVLHAAAPRPRKPAVAAGARSDAERCIHILTLAFAGDPPSRWMYPDPGQYLRYFPEFVRAFGGAAFESGAVEILDNFAAALWLAPGSHPDEAALADLIHRSIPTPHRDRVLALFEQFDEYHPQEPHWHLPLIGVDPGFQRQGYGSALLKNMLRRLDEQKAPAYLEATCPENVSLYERHGFEVIGVIHVRTSPPIFPMLRKPM
jgi:ribosomal protein S18 acetylase RimI-like enzyme